MDCSGLVSGFGFQACGSAFRVDVVLEVVWWQIAHAHETRIRSSMLWAMAFIRDTTSHMWGLREGETQIHVKYVQTNRIRGQTSRIRQIRDVC